MLTTLSTVKARLALSGTDFDVLLTSAIRGVSARFDRGTNRTLARTVDAAQEFDGDDVEIVVACYPVEGVSKFEVKVSEGEGWVEQADVGYLIHRWCVISLQSPFTAVGGASCVCRVTYTGGFVLPGATLGPGQTALPDDLEQAAVEQVAAWFQNRDKLGLIRDWPSGGDYQVFSQAALLPSVAAVLKSYQRFTI